ncbi:MAG: endonuclease III [Nitrospinae bacterium]|nr:endonuclease III [Nitrospinota bacterium]MBI3814788.1 endonuclease III [Nitrospinota bacterium]
MDNSFIHAVIKILKKEVKKWKDPIVTRISMVRQAYHEDKKIPFKVLISCILSLRTKDETTSAASQRLFSMADTPETMVRLTKREIERAIYPVGFYRTKTENILLLCRELINRHNSRVPDTIDELLKFRGVGRKTANLVVTLGYKKPGICVDTHVHRITNRWGYVKTKTPEETEFALREKLPPKYWLIINNLLVTYGQNLCKPISPYCSICPLDRFCKRVGVDRSR